ncbi:50S ribosomal protein L4, partial [bacterium]|nr:50S ribosomal protein L4 [bacterium]
SDVRGSGVKMYRQKGTGRSRQGERSNPHLTGGGLAFPPRPRLQHKKLNKKVRRSALNSAVLWHVQNDSAFRIDGKDFDGMAKTKEVAQVLDGIPGTGQICLVLSRDCAAWRSSRNLAMVRLLAPEQLNVRDLVECDTLIFAKSALDAYKGLFASRDAPQAVADGAEDKDPDESDTTEGAEEASGENGAQAKDGDDAEGGEG